MAKKLQLHAVHPPKLSRKPGRTITVERVADLDELRIALPILEPRGPQSAMLKALKILATDDNDKRRRVELAVQHLLINLNHANPRPKEEIAKLLDIEAAANLVEARLHQLHFDTRLALLKELAPILGKSTSTLVSQSEIQTVFLEISAKSATLRRHLSKNGVSAANPGRPSNSPGVVEFMQEAISIFASARGADSVTSTIPSGTSGAQTCYAFAHNLFKYATNDSLGHVRQFRRLVATFRKRRKISLKR